MTQIKFSSLELLVIFKKGHLPQHILVLFLLFCQNVKIHHLAINIGHPLYKPHQV